MRPWLLASLIGTLFLVIVAGTALGPVEIPFWHSLGIFLRWLGFDTGINFTPTEQRIIERLRLPRILLAGLVGGGLALVGAVFQALFRNSLAEPGITGVSSGGSLGAVLVIAAGWEVGGLWTRSGLAFVFATATSFLVYALATNRGRVQMSALLLAGVAVSSFCGACISIVLTFTRNNELLRELVFWLLGGFINRSWEHLAMVILPVSLGTAVCFFFIRDLNLLLAGEEEAGSLGVNVPLVRLILLLTTALITAACVSVSGTIGFVGLIVPHLVRLVSGPDHRWLLPLSWLTGAIFLMVADTAARLVLQPQELPVGVLTAFLGAPFFLSLLYARRNKIF